VTTEGGLNVAAQLPQITEAVKKLQAAQIPVSLFIDADLTQIEAATKTTAQFIELHTGSYAEAKSFAQQKELEKLAEGCRQAIALGLRVNAGHGLTYWNVQPVAQLPGMEELNTIISRAALVGMERAVREMKSLIQGAPVIG
jgi:pyridoxine 5-phosphate synthase